MRTARIRAGVLAAACIGWAATGGAWVTNIGAGAHGAWTSGEFYIGSNTSGNAINLFEGGTFRTTVSTYLGYDSGANSNAVTIDGAGSVWTNTAWHFRIGESGDYNSMTITDGGRFDGSSGSALYLGWNADSRYNSLVVSGTNSSVELQYDLWVGSDGSANYFELSDGATLDAGRDFGLSRAGGAAFNTGLVTGVDSRLTAGSRHFYVGDSGSNSNLLTVAGGGEIGSGRNLYIGGAGGSGNVLDLAGGTAEIGEDLFVGHGTGSSANRMYVNANSTVTVATNLYVGNYSGAAGNLLAVTNGGGMLIGGFTRVGGDAQSAGNLLLVEGAGSWVTNTGALTVHSGTNNRVIIRDGGRLVLTAESNVGQQGSVDAQLLVDGAGSMLYAAGNLNVGNRGVGTRLVVTNGGALDVANLRSLSWSSPVDDGSVIHITGAGTTATARNYTAVGLTYSDNHLLLIDDGAKMTSGGSHSLFGGDVVGGYGFSPTASNTLRVTGSGSEFASQGNLRTGLTDKDSHHRIEALDGGRISVANQLHVGVTGSWNRLEVAGGGTLQVNSHSHIGMGAGSEHNEALVTGAGSAWTNTGNMFLHSGADSRLTVADGARLYSDGYLSVGFTTNAHANVLHIHSGGTGIFDNVYLGWEDDTGCHRLIIEGQGSALLATNPSGDILIGRFGSANYLEISDGGRMHSDRFASLGYLSSSGYNTGLVTGAGSVWSTEANGDFTIGREGSYNELYVTAGGRVESDAQLQIGGNPGSVGNLLAVTNGGGVMANGGLVIGGSSTAGDNRLLIEGQGSWVTNAAALTMGGDNNRLTVRDGGRLTSTSTNDYVDIGFAGGSHNEALVESGGRLETAERLRIGNSSGAVSNLLHVANGGVVDAGERLYIGGHSASGDNRLLIEGQDSSVSVADSLYIDAGNDNQLIIRDGGRLEIFGDHSYIGRPGSVDALALVDGAGSILYSATRTLNVGSRGIDTRLVVTNGATLDVGNLRSLTWDTTNTDEGTFIHITGAGTTATIGNYTAVGLANSFNHLLQIDDGAKMTSGGWHGTFGGDVVGGYGFTPTASNTLRVTGSGSEFASQRNLRMGLTDTDSHHRIEVLEGGLISVDDELHAGVAGSNNRLLVSGGALRVSGDSYIGMEAGGNNNEALVNGSGSAWTNHGTIFVGSSGAVGNRLRVHDGARLESGAIEVRAGGMLELSNVTVYVTAESNPFVVQDGGLLRGSGKVEPDYMADPDPFFIDGTVSPGFSIGTLEFVGSDLALGANAVVVMEIAGETDFDQIVLEWFGEGATRVGGELAFNGTLQLSLLGGYEPQLHDSFQLFTADSYLDIENMFIDDSDAQLSEGWMSWQLNPDGSVSVIPEAATTGSMLLGLALLAALRRRLRTCKA